MRNGMVTSTKSSPGRMVQRAGIRKSESESSSGIAAAVPSISLTSGTDLTLTMREVKETIIAGGIDLTKPTALRRQVEHYVIWLKALQKRAPDNDVERIGEEIDSWQNLLTPSKRKGIKSLLADA